jgi:hypothetical protein
VTTESDNTKGLRAMHLEAKRHGEVVAPLERLTLLKATPGTIVVQDGCGREYFRAPSQSDLQFVVGGTLGCHSGFAAD